MSGPRQAEKRTADAALNLGAAVVDYRERGQWLRAAILGANDGLLSTASLMLGVGAVKHDGKSMVISGLAGLVAGACSMAIGEFVSVCSQRDIELSNRKGGVRQLTEDADGLPSPVKAACASATAFCVGSAVPLVAASFILERWVRLVVTVCVSSAALAAFGLAGAYLGRSPLLKSSARVLLGGWLAMFITFGTLYLFASYP